MAFLRQRRKRGHPGIVLDPHGHIAFASKQVREELMVEYATIIGRRDLVGWLSAKMLEEAEGGISEASARRQVRRWLRETGAPEGTLDRFNAWKARRARRRP